MSRKIATRLLLVITTLLLSACASKLSEEDCHHGNAFAMGLQDGNRGRAMSSFKRYQTDCNRYGVSLDHNAYLQGWAKGNDSYCQPDTAFRLGKSGEPYPLVCSDHSTSLLRNEYHRGLEVYQRIQLVQKRISTLESHLDQVNYKKAEIKSVQQRITVARKQLQQSKTAAEKTLLENEMALLQEHEKLLHIQLADELRTAAAEQQYWQQRQTLLDELKNLQMVR